MFSSVALISRSAWSFVLFSLEFGRRVAARPPFQSTTPGGHEEKDSDPNKNDVNSPGELTTIKIGC
jgi:hypothetical protein